MSGEGAAEHTASATTVSVICRTTGRPSLQLAIDSVCRQTHPAIELVIVNAGADGPLPDELVGRFSDPVVVTPERPLSRPEAANAGLDASTGQYLLFLDDDDWIAPRHIEQLLHHLKENPGCLAAYSDAREAAESGELLDTLYTTAFDPALLLKDNYIPIHTVLFSRGLLGEGCRFDETLDIYEDWDFWIQCSRHTDFLHVPDVTAYYRQGGNSATRALQEKDKYRPGNALHSARIQVINKWLPQWGGEQLNRLIGRMDSTDYIRQLEATIRSRDLQLERQEQAHDALQRNLNQKIEHRDREIAELRDGLHALREQLEELRTQLRALYESTSWRVTAPLRFLSRTRQRLGRAVVQRPWGRSLYYRIRPQPQPYHTPSEGKSPEDIKAEFSGQYRGELTGFLERGDALDFTDDRAPEVSVLLVLYNQAHLTLQCLLSLQDNCHVPIELIIVDNASSDETDALLSRLGGPVRVIRNDSNRGFVEAVNQGAAVASGRLLLLLNNDAAVRENTIEAAAAHFRDASDTGAVGGRIILLDGTLQEAGSIIWNDGSCAGYGRGDHPERPQYLFRREVDYCSGAFLMTPTELFHSLGGFDTDYAPAYYEETDYCIRLHKAGYRVLYEPDAVITHYEFASSGGFANASRLQERHREVLHSKHSDYLASRLPPSDRDDVMLRARSTGDRARILVVDDRVPDPAMGSGYPRANDILALLVAFGNDVTLYPLTHADDSRKTVRRLLPACVETMLHSGIPGLADFLASRASFYDVIVVSREHNMRLFNEAVREKALDLSGTRIVYDAEALTASREVCRLRLAGKMITQAREQRMIADEIDLARGADLVVAVNEQEADQFRQAGIRAEVLGHCTPVRLTPTAFEDREGFLFVGALRENESPNVDSILWFTEQVLPRIESLMEKPPPVYVAGDNTATALRAITNPGVHLLGRQPDLTGYYDRCRVFIAPTRFAAGIPHKVHEAAAHGVPVCATELLASQLGWEHGRQLLAASDAASFADQCVSLYEDGALWQTLRDNAARAMETECSEEAFRERLKQIIGA